MSKGASDKSKYHSFPAYAKIRSPKNPQQIGERNPRSDSPAASSQRSGCNYSSLQKYLTQLDLPEKQGHLLDDADWGN
ncbi:MAG: hypothetical protein R3C61_19655 [Bacteroidia bacterium]